MYHIPEIVNERGGAILWATDMHLITALGYKLRLWVFEGRGNEAWTEVDVITLEKPVQDFTLGELTAKTQAWALELMKES